MYDQPYWLHGVIACADVRKVDILMLPTFWYKLINQYCQIGPCACEVFTTCKLYMCGVMHVWGYLAVATLI